MTTSTRFMMAAMVAITCTSRGQAVERIRYEDIPSSVAHFGSVLENRGFNVTTVDGTSHASRSVRFDLDHIRVFHLNNNTWEDLPTSRIARIEIRQRQRFFHHIVNSAKMPLGLAAWGCGDFFTPDPGTVACRIGLTALFSPVWAYTATTGPFFLAADGVAFFIPPKIYEIVH